jgi:hypothetical protein
MGLEPHGLPSTAFVVPVEQRGTKIRRGPVIAGVFALAVIAAAAVVAATADGEGSEDALFVLPADTSDWGLADGVIADDTDLPATSERFITRGRLFGTPDGDGFRDLRSEVNYDESPLAGARWDEIDTPWGNAYRRDDDSITIARQQWEGTWQVASSPDDLIHVYDIIGNDIADLAIVAAFLPPDVADPRSTSFTMSSPDGATYSIATSPSSSPLFDVATFADRVEPIDIDGTDGWIVTEELDDGTETTVTWSASDDHTVTVRGTTSPATVIDAARSLQPVSEDDWTAAVGASRAVEHFETGDDVE